MPEVLSTVQARRPREALRPRAKFLPKWTDLCVEVRPVRVDEARDPLQTKTKHCNMIFTSVIYIITIKLSLRIKKDFCVLVDNSYCYIPRLSLN